MSGGSKFVVDLQQLPPGFHRRRFQGRGVGCDAYVWRDEPGPVLLLNGATHGDEYEGPTLLRQWAATWRPNKLKGTVVLVPVLNEAAFSAGRRCDPSDEVNLARAFPGQAKGSATSRLAHLFETQLLAQCTHYVDLHSGGSAYELLPWAGYMTGQPALEETQRAMAACFDQFWCWAGPFLPGRTLSAAYHRGIPAIYVECRGAGGVEPRDLAALDRGMQNLLSFFGHIPARRRLRPQRMRTADDAGEAHLQIHHPAEQDGIFVPLVRLGDEVRHKQKLGEVLALGRLPAAVVRAERAGRIVLVRYQRSVRLGDALFTIAPV